MHHHDAARATPDTLENRADWHVFDHRDQLGETLAAEIAARLSAAIEQRGAAAIAVSGGSTPDRLFAALSRQDLAWEKIVVTLIDERFVPISSPRSNAALVSETLLQGPASAAHFEPLYEPEEEAADAAQAATRRLRGLALPLDVAILGMGTDGHTASFFPGAKELSILLDPDTADGIYATSMTGGDEPRLTWPLSTLLKARFTALHIEGEDKRSVLLDTLSGGDDLPIRSLFAQSGTSIPVYWAPKSEE